MKSRIEDKRDLKETAFKLGVQDVDDDGNAGKIALFIPGPCIFM